MKTKTCTRCAKKKRIEQFYVHAQGKRPGLVSARCKVCERDRMRAYYNANTAKKKVWFSARYKRLKDDVFNAYGGYRCSCCGESEPLFLTIDHIDGKGAEHRRTITADGRNYRDATGYKTYRWLENNGFPPGFRVLCANCNHGTHRNGGICPHQRSEGSTTIPKGSTAKRPEVRSTS